MDFIKQEETDLKNIFHRFKKRDFSGDSGQAIKNSSYQLAQNIIFKFGSLVFTIIIARILLPDRMGVYTLALSTIILFSTFSDLGISSAIMTFVSKKIGEKKYKKVKGYVQQLFKWKISLLIFASILLGACSYFIANYYYQKPIFYALLAGVFYIPAVGLLGFVEQLFKSNNNFKIPFIKEIIFQILRFLFIPLLIIALLKINISNQKIVFSVIMGLTFCYLISLMIIVFLAKKKLSFLSLKSENLTKKEKKHLIAFILPLSTIAFSGIFFGYIDTLMLGHYVSERFIAYYGTAFALIGGVSVLIGFTSNALFPIFARKHGNQLESIFKKTRNFTLFFSILGGIITYFLSYYAVFLIYGQEYLPSTSILKLFSLLIIILPLSGLYDAYYTSREKTKLLMWLLILSTALNIILNVFGITYGLKNYGEMGAVFGACIATILSRGIYLGGLIKFRKKD